MMANPSAAAATAAGEETTTTTEDKTRRAMLDLGALCLFVILIGAVSWASISARRPAAARTPGFSVTVSDVVAGLDPERSPLIHPALDLTLRVDNPMDSKICWENATVTVSSYGDTVLGLGHLFRQLCVDKGASAEVKAALSPVHVMLPDDRLRGLMASKLRTGELELLVQLRMMLVPNGWYCHSVTPDILIHYCHVSPGHGFSPCNCHALEIAQKRQDF